MGKFKIGDKLRCDVSFYGTVKYNDTVIVTSTDHPFFDISDSSCYFNSKYFSLVKENQMSKADKVYKITEKKTVGYTYTTVDFVEFKSDKAKGTISISKVGDIGAIELDITPHTIKMLSELFRYLGEEDE